MLVTAFFEQIKADESHNLHHIHHQIFVAIPHVAFALLSKVKEKSLNFLPITFFVKKKLVQSRLL